MSTDAARRFTLPQKAAINRRTPKIAPFRRRRETDIGPLLTAVCTIVVLASAREGAGADTGRTHRLIGPGVAMDVDTRWVDGGGYRPVRITVTPTAQSVADRTLSVQFSVRRYENQTARDDLRVVCDIEIPAGSGPVQTVLSVPQMVLWDQYRMSVWENGRAIRGMSVLAGANTVAYSPYAWMWAEKAPAVLAVGNSLPDTTNIGRLVNAEEFYQMGAQQGVTPSAPPAKPLLLLPTAISRPLSELPERWIDYSSLDIVCVALPDLEQLAAKRPAAIHALMDWTAAGGNLVVTGMGQTWERLPNVERLLGMEPPQDASSRDPSARGWTWPDKRHFGRPVNELGPTRDPFAPVPDISVAPQTFGPGWTGNTANMGATVDLAATQARDGSPASKLHKPPDQPDFVLREHQMGMVVAMRTDAAFPGTATDWAWILNELTADRFLWHRRHGLSVRADNADYFKFLIPGVGFAPVNAFRILITLFVVAIGPVNYFLLRRTKRLHWLLITVPASAGIVTLILFAYAVLADGLGVRVRARSVTLLDQRRGHATSWSRLSYYAGLTPSGGLRFSEDVAVFPLERVPAESIDQNREMVWENDQRLISGWLPPRTPTQLVTVRSRPSRLGLVVAVAPDASGRLRVENRLGVAIEQLALATRDGKHYWSDIIAPQAAAAAESIDATSVVARLGPVVSAAEPNLPAGFQAPRPSWFFGPRRYSSYYFMSQQGGLLATSDQSSRLEQTLVLRPPGPGTYLAVVKQSPEIELGTRAAREEAGFHVVMGEW